MAIGMAPAAADAAADAEAEETWMAMSALLLFGAPPEAAQHREMCMQGLNILLAPANLVSAVKYAFAVRSFCRELMVDDFPPYPFESGDTHLKVVLDEGQVIDTIVHGIATPLGTGNIGGGSTTPQTGGCKSRGFNIDPR